MLKRLLPERVDRYAGHPSALWIFGLITVATIVRSLIHVFKHDGGAQSVATIPLEPIDAGPVLVGVVGEHLTNAFEED